MGEFQDVVIELWSIGDKLPEEGSPSDWIAEGKVGYCDGEPMWFVADIPLWKLLWWKWQIAWADGSLTFRVWWSNLTRPGWDKRFWQSAHTASPEQEQTIRDDLDKMFHIQKG